MLTPIKLTERGFKPPYKRTAKRTCRYSHNLSTSLWKKITPNNCPLEIPQAQIGATIPGITSKGNHSEAILKALTLEEIDKHYPTASWTHIYSDSSAKDRIGNGVCSSCTKHPGKSGETVGSNYKTNDLEQLNATGAAKLWEKKAVFLTDSLSALYALWSDELDVTLKELTKSINASPIQPQ